MITVYLRSRLYQELIKDEKRRYEKEIGGFVLGKYRDEDFIVFDRLIECPNISKFPYISYCPEEECTERACELAFRRDHNTAITLFHTHPRDTFFSVEDVKSLITLCQYTGQEYIPAFLSTYDKNKTGHFVSYGLCHYVLATKYFEIESRSLDNTRRKLFLELNDLANKIEYTITKRSLHQLE